jgi:hypothetical protein
MEGQSGLVDMPVPRCGAWIMEDDFKPLKETWPLLKLLAKTLVQQSPCLKMLGFHMLHD